MPEPITEVLAAVNRLIDIRSTGVDAGTLSALALQSAIDELSAIAADEPRSLLTAAALKTAELFLSAASPARSPSDLGPAIGGLRVLLAVISAAQLHQLVDAALGLDRSGAAAPTRRRMGT